VLVARPLGAIVDAPMIDNRDQVIRHCPVSFGSNDEDRFGNLAGGRGLAMRSRGRDPFIRQRWDSVGCDCPEIVREHGLSVRSRLPRSRRVEGPEDSGVRTMIRSRGHDDHIPRAPE
jgi:hypothetical protein